MGFDVKEHPSFDEMYVNANVYGRKYSTVTSLARKIFANPNETINVYCFSEDDAIRVFMDLKILYGMSTENLKVKVVQKMDTETPNAPNL